MPYGYGMAPSAGTVAHALILPKGGDGALAKVVAHAHVKPCAEGKGGGHWMHDATKDKSDTSNKLYVLGPVGRWYKTMAAWKVNLGSAISGVQETRPRSIVVHDPDTMAKALCCDLKWDDGWDLTPAPKSPVPGNGDSGDDGANEGMPYDSGDDGANEGMPYDSGDDGANDGMAPSAGTVAHALILPKGGDGALAKVVAHAHVK